MIKIIHMTTVHSYNDNRIFYKECAFLKKKGYDVCLLVAGEDSREESGIKIIGFKKEKNRVLRYLKTSLFDIVSIALRHNGDIYHFHDPELLLAGLYLKAKGKVVVYDIHENYPASILSKPYIKNNLLKNIISKSFNLFEKMAVKYFDALVTARPDITKMFNHTNMITLRNYPILPEKNDVKTIDVIKNKPTVIYVGGMSEIRGTEQLLDAFEKLDEYELWLLGPIKDESIQKRIEKKCKNVKYLGSVSAKEIFYYISLADVGIVTFLPVPNHITTLATKPFEYMACGKPIIMSNFDYWKKTFKHSSLYVDPTSPKEIAETVKMLLKDNERMRNMSTVNKYLAENEYNWEYESKKLSELYSVLTQC